MRKSQLIFILSLLVLSSVAIADYKIVWGAIGGGGGQSSGGQYVLIGTIGMTDAALLAGGSYEVLGGFWVGSPLCFVEFEDFARFAVYWLQSGSGLAADLYPDNNVNAVDLLEFANWWLCTCPYGWQLE